MKEAQLQAAVSKMIVGLGARIPLPDFVRAYDDYRSLSKQSPQFAALEADFGSAEAALVPAIQRARDDQFFTPLWTTLLERLRLEEDATANAITEALATGSIGTMQRVLRAEGFRRVASWPRLIRAAKVTALIKVNLPGGIAYGTGFLVGPDLLMTAAHVVSELVDDEGQARDGSADQIVAEFHNQLESSGHWPIVVRVAKRWLEAMSPPLGTPPQLAPTNVPDAGQRLDFALIRLAEQVGGEIGFIDMRNPPEAEKNVPLTIIGYPGGSDCLSDDHLVIDLEAAAARVRHGVNAVAGMSGSPCFGGDGMPVAIHEGAVDTPPPYNRAIALRSIRAVVSGRVPDLLDHAAGPLMAIDDTEARRQWAIAGEMRSSDPQTRASWLSTIAPFDPRSTAGAQSDDSFHPVFGRTAFVEWLERASASDAESRVAFVTGPPLSGKSFSLNIIRDRLRRGAQQLIALGPEALRDPLSVAIDRMVRMTAIAPTVGAGPGGVALRPLTGVARRDVVPAALNDLERLVGARQVGSRLLWLVLDFGTDLNMTAELSAQWKEWLTQSAPRSWLRTVVIGLRSSRQKEFAAALTPPTAFREDLNPLGIDDFQASMEAVLGAVAPLVEVSDVQERIDEDWDQIDQLTPAEGRTVEAVRAVLVFRQTIRNA